MGHPQPPLSGTGVLWVSCRDPPVCHDVQGDIVTERQPLCVVLVLCCCWLTAVWESLCTWNIDTPFAAWDSQALAATQCFFSCLQLLNCVLHLLLPGAVHPSRSLHLFVVELQHVLQVLQAIHGLNLRLVSPRSHLGTSLLPGLYCQLLVVVPTSFLVRDGVYCN